MTKPTLCPDCSTGQAKEAPTIVKNMGTKAKPDFTTTQLGYGCLTCGGTMRLSDDT